MSNPTVVAALARRPGGGFEQANPGGIIGFTAARMLMTPALGGPSHLSASYMRPGVRRVSCGGRGAGYPDAPASCSSGCAICRAWLVPARGTPAPSVLPNP